VPREFDRLLRYPRGRSIRLARAGHLLYIRLPDGEIRFNEAEIERLVCSSRNREQVPPSPDAKELIVSKQFPSTASPAADPTVRALSPGRRRLVTSMQRLTFGRIERLVIRRGEPVLDGADKPRVVRTVRAGRALGRRNTPRPQADSNTDFALRQEVIDLLAWFDAERDAVIDRLEIVDGLPVHWDAEEPTLPA
jgi:hypothetical protein